MLGDTTPKSSGPISSEQLINLRKDVEFLRKQVVEILQKQGVFARKMMVLTFVLIGLQITNMVLALTPFFRR